MLRQTWLRLSRDKKSVVGLSFVAVVVVAALVAPYAHVPDPFAESDTLSAAPSLQHLMGTDHLGRDIFSGVVWGARVSLLFGLVVALLSALLGIAIGAISGYYGGALDDALSRLMEVTLSVPTLFLIILIVTVYGSNLLLVMVAVGLSVWPPNARIMRAQVLAAKHQDYVAAAVLSGTNDATLLVRHIIPSGLAPIVANSTLIIGFAIALEAGLAFLGLGDPNVASWGQMLYSARSHYTSAWWMAVFPGASLTVTVLGFNLVGDSLASLLDPRIRQLRVQGSI